MKINWKKYLKPKIILHWFVLAWVVLTAIAFVSLLQPMPMQFPSWMMVVGIAIVIAVVDILLEETLGI